MKESVKEMLLNVFTSQIVPALLPMAQIFFGLMILFWLGKKVFAFKDWYKQRVEETRLSEAAQTAKADRFAAKKFDLERLIKDHMAADASIPRIHAALAILNDELGGEADQGLRTDLFHDIAELRLTLADKIEAASQRGAHSARRMTA